MAAFNFYYFPWCALLYNLAYRQSNCKILCVYFLSFFLISKIWILSELLRLHSYKNVNTTHLLFAQICIIFQNVDKKWVSTTQQLKNRKNISRFVYKCYIEILASNYDKMVHSIENFNVWYIYFIKLESFFRINSQIIVEIGC